MGRWRASFYFNLIELIEVVENFCRVALVVHRINSDGLVVTAVFAQALTMNGISTHPIKLDTLRGIDGALGLKLGKLHIIK